MLFASYEEERGVPLDDRITEDIYTRTSGYPLSDDSIIASFFCFDGLD
jgi:hypothetical protein